MNWFAMIPAVAFAVAVLVLPGLIIGAALRLRGVTLWGMAMPMSVSVVALSTLWAPFANLSWSLLPVLLTTAAITIIALALRLALPKQFTAPKPLVRQSWAPVGALSLAAIIITTQLVLIVGHPENFSQTFDNVFHLNAIRYALDTGSASPLTLQGLTTVGDTIAFYPSGWHALASLTIETTGVSIPMASNAVMIAVAAVAWPAGILLLTQTLFPTSTLMTWGVGALAGAFTAFPLFMIDYGVLYPYFLAVALLPAIIAMTIRLLHRDIGHSESTCVLILVILGSLPGLTISHPGALVAWLAASAVIAVWTGVSYARSAHGRKLVGVIAACLVWVLTVAMLWEALRPVEEARGWQPTRTIPQAMGEVAFFGTSALPLSIICTFLVWTGIITIIRRRNVPGRIAIALYVLFGGLYITGMAMTRLGLRDLITGPWYNDAHRLAALIPIAALPLAAYGFTTIVRWIGQKLPFINTKHTWQRTVGIGVAVAAVVVGTAVDSVDYEIERAHSNYEIRDDSPLITTDELALLNELPGLVPEDAKIAGSPWTGTGLAYAFANREVLMPHILTEVSESGDVINNSLDRSTSIDEVCDALEDEDVRYVLDFGTQEVHGAEHVFPGLDKLDQSDRVREVRRIGDAALYEITACGYGQ